MEALAAVSLAGNMIQFPQLHGRCGLQEPQNHASTLGSLKAHEDLEGLKADISGPCRLPQATEVSAEAATFRETRGRRPAAELWEVSVLKENIQASERHCRYQVAKKS